MPCGKTCVCCHNKSQLQFQQPLCTVDLLSPIQHPRVPDEASDAPGCMLTTSVSGAAVLPLTPRAPAVAALPAVGPAESQFMPQAISCGRRRLQDAMQQGLTGEHQPNETAAGLPC